MWVMVTGPYTAGGADPEQQQANLRMLNKVALAVFERGHIPVIGVNNALPVIAEAGEARFDELMMPISLAMAERCDAVLRVGGASRGADQEVARFQAAGKPIYSNLEELPPTEEGRA